MKSQTYDEINRGLEQELSELKAQTQDFIELTEMAIGLCVKVIVMFREKILLDGFQTDDEEIYFFKHIKPRVYSKFIFYTEVFNIETYRLKEGKKEQIRYLKVSGNPMATLLTLNLVTLNNRNKVYKQKT